MERIGQYEPIERIGRGGMGDVWKARDTELDRLVALKLLQATTPEDLARFEREARLVARLSHPHIAQVYEFGEKPSYIAMQLIDGVPLDESPLPLRRKIEAMRDVARAIHYANGQGVLHRDLKPDNILVDASGHAFVLDFGLAREVQRSSSMSLTGDILGTPAFMSPEQARGDLASLDARTDVYGLGATLYNLIAGRPPHTGPTAFDVVHRVLFEEPSRTGADRDLETIALKALEKDPRRRYASAEALEEDLDRYLRGDAIVARPASMWYRLRKRVGRAPWVWGLSAALVMLVLGGIAAALADRARADELERRRRAAQAHVDRGRAVVERLRATSYMEGCNLAPFWEALKAAQADFAEAQHLDPKNLDAAYWSAQAYREAEEPERAIAELDRALAFAPDDPRLRIEKGKLLLDAAFLSVLTDEHSLEDRERTLADAAAEALAYLAGLESLPGAEIESAVARGYAHLAARNLKGVQEILDRFVERHGVVPGVEELWHLRGLLGERLESFDRALELRPGYVRARIQRAYAYLDAGRPRDALADVDEAVRLNPNCIDAYNVRARVHRTLGDSDREMADLNAALAIRPDSALGLNARGMAFARGNDDGRAAVDFDAAIRANPAYAAGWVNRAEMKGRRGDYAGAKADLLEAVRLRPDVAGIHSNLGMALFKLGEIAAAKQALDRAVETDPRSVLARSTRGDFGLDTQDWAAAEADYSEAILLDDRHVQSYRGRGYARFRLRRYDEALRDYSQALAVGGKHAPTYFNRALCLDRLGRPDEAIASLDEALALAPDSFDMLALRGYLLRARGRLDESFEDLDRAATLMPGSASAHVERGITLLVMRQYESALADFEEAVRLDPALPEAFSNRGLAKLRLGDREGALGDFRESLKLGGPSWEFRETVERLMREASSE